MLIWTLFLLLFLGFAEFAYLCWRRSLRQARQRVTERLQAPLGHFWAFGALSELSQRGIIGECVTLAAESVAEWDQDDAAGVRASEKQCLEVIAVLAAHGSFRSLAHCAAACEALAAFRDKREVFQA